MRATTAGLMVGVALALSQLALAAPQKLTAAQVRASFVGMTNYGTQEAGKPFVSYIAPKGVIKIRGDGFADVGRYRIERDGRICIKYQKLRGGTDLCEFVFKDGDKVYTTFIDGKPAVIITRSQRGNVEKL